MSIKTAPQLRAMGLTDEQIASLKKPPFGWRQFSPSGPGYAFDGKGGVRVTSFVVSAEHRKGRWRFDVR